MDTTSHPPDITEESVDDLIADLIAGDPADAPDVAAVVARVLARDLDAASGGGDPEQLRAPFDAASGRG